MFAPVSLACFMAAPAFLSRVDGVSPSSGQNEMPMHIVNTISCPSKRTGVLKAAAMREASRRASPSVSMPRATTTNSSAPRRPGSRLIA